MSRKTMSLSWVEYLAGQQDSEVEVKMCHFVRILFHEGVNDVGHHFF